MKSILVIICCCLSWMAQAQHKTVKKKSHRHYGHGVVAAPAPPEIFTYVEQQAEFPGGQQKMIEYINNRLRYPDAAREAGIEGKVLVQFRVDENGKIADAHVIKGIWVFCDAEALRVVNSMPSWQPAKRNGRAMKSYFILPVMFRIQS